MNGAIRIICNLLILTIYLVGFCDQSLVTLGADFLWIELASWYRQIKSELGNLEVMIARHP